MRKDAQRLFRALSMVIAIVLLPGKILAQVHEEAELKSLRDAESRSYSVRYRAGTTTSAASNDIDVTYYGLNFSVNATSQTLRGSVLVQARALSALNSITLDLSSAMTVDSVKAGSQSALFQQTSSALNITLDRTYILGEQLAVEVFYGGTPSISGFGSFAFSTFSDGSPWVWTLSEPYGARDWWPCKDHPSDKADSVDITITCDSHLKTASQGVLVSAAQNADGTTTYRWKHRYPIATYLISLAIGNYDVFSDWYRYTPTDSMEVVNYVMPTLPEDSRDNLHLTVQMLEIFSDLFGQYPFIKEKYGHAHFGWGGGMEHQTITSLGNFSEGVIAHELAHQWFGDMITMARWRDIWLNEGFATYSVALYNERQYGLTSYWNYMNSVMSGALQAAGTLSVADTTTVSTLFDGRLVYAKGATVLHMLRHVVGDSVFFAALKAYANDTRFRFKTASTEDLQAVFESVSGSGLTYFFSQWVYGENYPSYQCSWSLEMLPAGSKVSVRVQQTTGTQNPSFFTMPIDLRFSGASFDTLLTVWNHSSDTTYSFTFPVTPLAFQLDPDGWILKTASYSSPTAAGDVGMLREYALAQNYPNPFNPVTNFEFRIADFELVKLTLWDVLGREVVTLMDEKLKPGIYTVQWNAGDQPSGIYFYRLTAGPFVETKKLVLLR